MIATTKVQLLQGRVPQDFQQVCGPIGTFGVLVKAPGVLKRGLWGIKGRQSVAAPLARDFCKSGRWQLSILHLWPFNVAKCCQKNSRDNGLNIRKKKQSLTNWPNIATNFAKRGTVRSLLLSNWSSWHRAASATQWTEFHCNTQSSTSPEESSARLPAGLRPHRHLWCHCQSTWNAQKGTVWIKGRQSVAAPLASDFCKSDHLQLSISHVLPFNVAKCCQRNSRDSGLNIQKNTASNELTKHRKPILQDEAP